MAAPIALRLAHKLATACNSPYSGIHDCSIPRGVNDETNKRVSWLTFPVELSSAGLVNCDAWSLVAVHGVRPLLMLCTSRWCPSAMVFNCCAEYSIFCAICFALSIVSVALRLSVFLSPWISLSRTRFCRESFLPCCQSYNLWQSTVIGLRMRLCSLRPAFDCRNCSARKCSMLVVRTH